MQALPNLIVADLIREVGDLYLQVVQRNKRIAQLEEELDSLRAYAVFRSGELDAASRLSRPAEDSAAAGAGEGHPSDLAR